jgi:Lipocalin-like domain
MKMNSYPFFCTAMLLCLAACQPGPDKKLLIGDWHGAEWLVEGQASVIDASSAAFTFMEDGSYSYTYSDAVETGKYYIAGNELFTTPKDGIKMMVKIIKLTPDTLVFDMNRGGTSEKLTLTRK